MAHSPVKAPWRFAALFVTLLTALLTAAGRAEDSPLLAELVALTERIEEAVRTGDRATLERLSLPEMRLVNRDGKSYSQRELLDDIVPLRPGYDLRFRVLEPELLHQGDAALLSFLLDEYLMIWGVDVSTVYRCNFLYFRRAGEWKLALFEYFEKPVDPTIAPLDPASYDALAGTYELAPGRWVTKIWRDGGKLFSRRDEGTARELLPLAPDRFFYAGAEGEIFFVRDAQGGVSGMVFRRNFKDLPYRRLPAGK